MKWLWIALAVLLAVAAGATWFAFQDPVFWTGLVAAIVTALAPIVLKRMAPETEARWRQSVREGLGWDFARKRPRRK